MSIMDNASRTKASKRSSEGYHSKQPGTACNAAMHNCLALYAIRPACGEDQAYPGGILRGITLFAHEESYGHQTPQSGGVR
jgi:hypothetical protein